MTNIYDCNTDIRDFPTQSVIKVSIIRYKNPKGESDEWAEVTKEVYYYSHNADAEREVSNLLKDWETHVYNGQPVKFVNAYNSQTKKVFRHDLIQESVENLEYVCGNRPFCVQTNEITIETIDVIDALELNNKIKKI